MQVCGQPHLVQSRSAGIRSNSGHPVAKRVGKSSSSRGSFVWTFLLAVCFGVRGAGCP